MWAAWLIPWLLIIGGTYSTFEGAEKAWHWVDRKRKGPTLEDVVDRSPTDEKKIVSGAIRTDLVLSIEIMLVALANIEADSSAIRLANLILVGAAMTALVYGSVAVLVKVDDVGAWLVRRRSKLPQVLGVGGNA